jgi:hypothetical protein
MGSVLLSVIGMGRGENTTIGVLLVGAVMTRPSSND